MADCRTVFMTSHNHQLRIAEWDLKYLNSAPISWILKYSAYGYQSTPGMDNKAQQVWIPKYTVFFYSLTVLLEVRCNWGGIKV